jgi:hypothetical protein
MQRLYNAPRSERAKVLELELARLDDDVGKLRASGIEIDDDDPMPLPIQRASPIDLEGLTNALTLDLGLSITHPGVPSTASPSRVSHDPQDRAALVTYGHPGLAPALLKVAANEPLEPLVRVEREGVVAWARADRNPPTLIERASELADLGEARSAGDAAGLAGKAIEGALRKREALVRRALLAARGQRLDRIRHDLVAAISTGVAARIRMDSTANGAMGPRTALNLLGAESSIWLSVDAVASWLAISLEEVLGQVRQDQVADTGTLALRAAITGAGKQLSELFKEIASLRASAGPSSALRT